MKAIQVVTPGGPNTLQELVVHTPRPGPGELLVKTAWAGVNFIDTYQRSGRYPLDLPATLGLEGAGEIAGMGTSVTGFHEGDRVAWAWAQGSYAEYVIVPAEKSVLIPESMSMEIAAASMMQGVTAQYLITSVYSAQPGDLALVHAAAGGVGLVLCQMLSSRGVTVIGTVSTDEKSQAARLAGAEHVIRYDREDFAPRLLEITQGYRCNVVYDSVGADTFEGSLQCLAPRATLVLFGAASGPVPPFDLQRLSALGSLTITRPTIAHFLTSPEENNWRATEVFNEIGEGHLAITLGGKYDLADAAQAHRDLESRATSGKLLLQVAG